MRALACPSSLKGVLSASAAARSLVEGFARAGVAADECPVADGGEGTAAVLAAALGGEWRSAVVTDPLGRAVDAGFVVLPDGTVVVEAARAIGLSYGNADPLRASSRGLGELIAAAGRGPMIICLGGVATVDGGAGLLEVIDSLPAGTRVACDVHTTLYDAPRLFGPQKGATPEMVVELEARLRRRPELGPFARIPGSGAAGGLGAALALLGAQLESGAELVLELIGFQERLGGVTLAVTGEGTVDATTAEGKAPAVILAACRSAGVRCAVFGGRIDSALAGAELFELSGEPTRAFSDLVALAESLGHALVRD